MMMVVDQCTVIRVTLTLYLVYLCVSRDVHSLCKLLT